MDRQQKIKGLFFDFDGVITIEKQGSPTIISYISKEANIPIEVVENAYYKHNDDLLYGNITHRDMWEQFCADIGKTIDYHVLEEAFMNVTIDEKLLDYIKEKHSDYLIGMITDNKADRINTIVNNTVLKELFDVVIISADVHSRKSERKIFEEALKQSGLKAEECVFVDNTASNLKIPSEMGFTTIFFDDDNRDFNALY
ncbi:putative hydrolase of the HAD superfamily [Butyrivibrio sp. INlla18]|uniref:HAD-IA family hydrolase n=1 Tax=Butyrivibrio sp. INlla18 TaxID=1520806 RepID=UPI0008884398|nr:HAD-IA family hydrolase [Butyrivibrio sp. INlla18]SDA38948.1 putative hydrolase of the HAD superfamily [Butyrivibrio sp. INlla18]